MATINPYAPPQADSDVSFQPGSAGGVQPWSPEEVLSKAWEIVKRHWPALVLGGGVIQVILIAVQQSVKLVVDPQKTLLVMGVSWIVSAALSAFFHGGLIQMSLTAARGGVPQFSQAFNGAPTYLPLLATALLTALASGCATLLFIIPGIIVYLGLSLSGYFVVDAGLSPVEAMKASWEAMKGNKWKLAGFNFGGGLVCLVGMLACGVGLFAAMAVVQVGLAIVFTRVSGRGQQATIA